MGNYIGGIGSGSSRRSRGVMRPGCSIVVIDEVHEIGREHAALP
jgi:hypothetical protein